MNFKRSKYKTQQRSIGKKANGHFDNVIKNNFGPIISELLTIAYIHLIGSVDKYP